MNHSLPNEGPVNQSHSGSGDNTAGNRVGRDHNENHGDGHITINQCCHQDSKSDPRQQLMTSLEFTGMNSRSHDIGLAASGTCDWLLGHKTYDRWTSRHHGLLCIKGKPGSGKSTLLRYASVKTPRTDGGNPLTLSFFFHGRGSELQRTPRGLFRSLSHQVLQAIPDALDHGHTWRQWQSAVDAESEEKHLRDVFEKTLEKALETRPVWLFVDALDECDNSYGPDIAKRFRDFLSSLSSCLKPLRICFTIRSNQTLSLSDMDEIRVDVENIKDISTYVNEQLARQQNVAKLITERANGMFLWACIAVRKVREVQEGPEPVTLGKIQDAILELPRELDELYDKLTSNMGEDSLKLFQWITFAMRPLEPSELQWAMLIDADRHDQSMDQYREEATYRATDIGKLSKGLVEVTPDEKVVQFIHQTVKDFFQGTLSRLNETSRSQHVAHNLLYKTCLRYLEMAEIDQSVRLSRNDMMSKFPLLQYATTSWVDHASKIAADRLLTLEWPEPDIIKRWVSVYRVLDKWNRRCPGEGTTVLHIMSRYGMEEELREYLNGGDGISVDSKDSNGWTPLSWAVQNGQASVVALLLSKGAKRDYKYKLEYGGLISKADIN
ncbi:Hypothetical protein NCS54_01198200 [Fusarium falciforme]|uniref:Hypothetical protein n=1 Tax=Fusarium falciforme TaxID=195108 RepID=UPI0023005218|nr:Hypothetical protein NCS54_01198200 [Fusarium falciforme]WAO94400.1 Hypothetical protein NCS54_01198200 [Fusarium falciforme]